MDSAEFRRMNLLDPGDEDSVGRPLLLVNVRPVLDAALEAGRWGQPKNGPGHGRGVAIFGRQIGGGEAGAVVTAEADGTFSVISPTVDVGTGYLGAKIHDVSGLRSVVLHRYREGEISAIGNRVLDLTASHCNRVAFRVGYPASPRTFIEGRAIGVSWAHSHMGQWDLKFAGHHLLLNGMGARADVHVPRRGR